MPRTIASDIGSRTLSIEDAADNWIAGTNALPNGHFGLAMEETPDTYSYAHDRVGDGAAYNFRNGQPRTINFWYRGVEQSAPFICGVSLQNSATIGFGTVNWMFQTVGNSLVWGQYRSGVATFQSLSFSLANNAGWRMITAVFDGGTGNWNTSVYLNGTIQGTVIMASAPANTTSAEFSLGAKATLSLSSLSPVATQVAPMELAKFAVFDTMLTPQNIADLYIAMQ